MADCSCKNKFAHLFYRHMIRGERVVSVKLRIEHGTLGDDYCVKCGKLRSEIFPTKYDSSSENKYKITDNLDKILGQRCSVVEVHKTLEMTCHIHTTYSLFKRLGIHRVNSKWALVESVLSE